MSIGDGIKAHLPAIPVWGWGILAGGGVLIYMAHRGNAHAAAALDPNNPYPAGTAVDAATSAVDQTVAQGQAQLALENAQQKGQLDLLNAGGAVQHQSVMDSALEQAGMATNLMHIMNTNGQVPGNITIDAPDGTSLSYDNSGYWANQLAGTQGAWANQLAGTQGMYAIGLASTQGQWANALAGTEGMYATGLANTQGYWNTQDTYYKGYWADQAALDARAPLPAAAAQPALVAGNPPAPAAATPPACASGNFACVRYACARGNYTCANSVAPWLNGQNPGW